MLGNIRELFSFELLNGLNDMQTKVGSRDSSMLTAIKCGLSYKLANRRDNKLFAYRELLLALHKLELQLQTRHITFYSKPRTCFNSLRWL